MRAPFCLIVLMTAVLFCGCRSAATHSAPDPVRVPVVDTNIVLKTRNNALSLLHQLLSDEQNVSKLLIIKRERKELHDLIKKISVQSGNNVKLLDQAVTIDQTLNFKTTDLPPGEQAARDTQTKTITKALLHSHGEDFEFKLLLSQAEALEYGSNLAKVAAVNEADAARRKRFDDMSAQLLGLYEEVTRMLRQPRHSAAH